MRRFAQIFSDFPGWPRTWAQACATLAGADDHYNIEPDDDAWIVLPGEEGARAARFRWGLVPPWSKEPKTRYATITARLERAARSRRSET